MARTMDVRLEAFDAEEHSPRLRRWLAQPHVSRWWGDPRSTLDAVLRRSPETAAILVADETPVGFLCWQSPSEDDLSAAGLTDLPEEVVDIDVFVGESELLGRGLGPRALELLLARLRADPGVSVAGVGTSVSNERAIRAFEKAGFRPFRKFADGEFGACVYMVADLHLGRELAREDDSRTPTDRRE